MGCDIHYVVEKKVSDRWVGLFSKYPRDHAWLAGQRCYDAFTELAGVRGSSVTANEPRGVPGDASELARFHVDRDGDDGHSHSWLTLEEFRKSYVRGLDCQIERFGDAHGGKWAADLRELSGKLGDPGRCWDLLFGSCPIRTYDETERDEDRIENYRIVFWFDN